MTLEQIAMSITEKYIRICEIQCNHDRDNIVTYVDYGKQGEDAIKQMYSGKSKELRLEQFYKNIGYVSEGEM